VCEEKLPPAAEEANLETSFLTEDNDPSGLQFITVKSDALLPQSAERD
jgi:hypothetical protein